MEKENLQFCKYYGGEYISPFREGSFKDIFWNLEKQYVSNDNFNHQLYEESAKEYISSHPKESNFLTSDAPIEQKGFVLFAEDMLNKWDPENVNIVFKYGE